MKTKGFTLIELLVVIAIIGLLASIILANLGTARNKASDATIQETLSGLRSSAEIYYSGQQGYSDGTAVVDTGCGKVANAANVFGDTTVANQLSSLTNAKYCTNNGTVGTKATTYAVLVLLTSNNTQAWCADSNGASKVETGLTAATLSSGLTSGLCK